MNYHRRWWWPRVIWSRGDCKLWFAPTFGGFGVALYPRMENMDRALSLGVWPFTLTYRIRQLDGGDV